MRRMNINKTNAIPVSLLPFILTNNSNMHLSICYPRLMETVKLQKWACQLAQKENLRVNLSKVLVWKAHLTDVEQMATS